MENLRYLLAAIAALTLIMSVVSSVNPSYFAGLNAFADHEDVEEADGTSGSSSTNEESDEEVDDEEHEDEAEDDENEEHELEQTLGSHSKATLEVDEDAELGVEIEDGDLQDQTYDITFVCGTDVNKIFTDSLVVEEGHGEFEADLALPTGEYAGCHVDVGELSATFPPFSIVPDQENDEEDEDVEENDEDHQDDNKVNGRESSSGSNSHDDDEEDDDNNSGRGSHSESSTDDKRQERKEKIVSTTSGWEVHEKHRNANPHSPGEYSPGLSYTLVADVTAIQAVEDETLLLGEDATFNVNMTVWKSNKAIILLDVVNGTVEFNDQDYLIRIGYAIYSLQQDAMKVVALATDDDGNVYRMKLRGSAVDPADSFPMETGSIDLLFGGDLNESNNRFEDSILLLQGTVTAS